MNEPWSGNFRIAAVLLAAIIAMFVLVYINDSEDFSRQGDCIKVEVKHGFAFRSEPPKLYCLEK